MDPKTAKRRYSHHVSEARRIVQHYEGKDMPRTAAAECQMHIDAAIELKGWLETPVYKHQMGEIRGVDGPAPRSGIRILGKSDPIFSGDESKVRGALGVLFKSLVGDVNEREVAHFLGAQAKDLLSTNQGGVVVPDPIASFVIDALRAKSVVQGLGARVVPMSTATLKVPRISSDAVPGWLAEEGTYGGEDPDLDDVTFKAKKLGQIVKLSEEVDEDSDPELAGDILITHLARVFALELDRAALRGDGTNDAPTGVRHTAGVDVQGSTGAADWTTLTALKRDLALADAECNGYVLNPRTADAIENEKDSTSGQFIAPPKSLDGIARLATTAVPNNLGPGEDEAEIFGGDWSHVMLGIRQRFELRRLTERYADEGKVALRARLRADVQLSQPAALAVRTGVTN
jgi:HK97 family phage major capsid protein